MVKFFDELENQIRGWLSHRPIIYGLIAGTGVVLFWRGVWHSMDLVMLVMANWQDMNELEMSGYLWWDGPLSIVIGVVILLLSGVFVSSFIGNEVILSGLRGEKKLTEKTERELKTEAGAIAKLQETLEDLRDHIKKH